VLKFQTIMTADLKMCVIKPVLLNNSETVKVTKNLKENKNVGNELLNSSMTVLQSVSAVTIQGVHESCGESNMGERKLKLTNNLSKTGCSDLVLVDLTVTAN